MRALLYKDWCVVKNTIYAGILCMVVAFYLGIITMLGFTKGNFQLDNVEGLVRMVADGLCIGIAMVGIYVTLMCGNIKDMDDKSGWYRVLYSSPVALWKELVSRYVILILSDTLFAALYAIIQPIILSVGGFTYGHSEMKSIAYVWLIGFIMICLRLPVDILLPAKESTAVYMGFGFLLTIVLVIVITVTENVGDPIGCYRIMESSAKFVYDHATIFIIGAGAVPYTVLYLLKKKHRWVR